MKAQQPRAFTLISMQALAALIILLLNDHWLKPIYGNWLTGKLSDFSAAFLIPCWLELLLIGLLRVPARRSILLASLMTAVALASIELSPLVIDYFERISNQIFTWAGWPARSMLTADPSDLLALVVIPYYFHLAYRRLVRERSTHVASPLNRPS